jgi:hypothetical protein
VFLYMSILKKEINMANSETSAKNPSLMAQLAGYFYSPTEQRRPDLVVPPPASLASSTSDSTESEPPSEVTLVVSPPSSSHSVTAHNAPTTEVTSEVVDTEAQVLVTSVMENSAPEQSQPLVDSADIPSVVPPTEASSSDSVDELPNETPATLQSTYHSVQGSAIHAKLRLGQLLANPNVQASIAGGVTALAISLGVNYAPHQDVDLDIDLTRDDVIYSTYVHGPRMIGAENLSSPGSGADLLSSTGNLALITAAAIEWSNWALEGIVTGVTSVAMIPFNLFIGLGNFMSSIPGYLSSFADTVSSAISSALGIAADVAKENPIITTAVTTVGVGYAAKRAVDFGYQVYKDRQAQSSTPTSSDSQQPGVTVSETPNASNDGRFRHLLNHLSEQVSRLPSFKH